MMEVSSFEPPPVVGASWVAEEEGGGAPGAPGGRQVPGPLQEGPGQGMVTVGCKGGLIAATF